MQVSSIREFREKREKALVAWDESVERGRRHARRFYGSLREMFPQLRLVKTMRDLVAR